MTLWDVLQPMSSFFVFAFCAGLAWYVKPNSTGMKRQFVTLAMWGYAALAVTVVIAMVVGTIAHGEDYWRDW